MKRRSFIRISAFAFLCTPLFSRAESHCNVEKIRGACRTLTRAGHGDNRATFMPNGETILFASKRTGKSQIWATDLKGNVRQFYQSDSNDAGRVASSADGQKISFSSDRSGQSAVYVLDIGSGATKVVSDPAVWSFGPSWSVRGPIAYFSRKGGNKLNIWTANPDGTGSRQITDWPGEARQPWWSAAGNQLAFSANRGNAGYSIWISEPDGSDARQVTQTGNCEQPFWSPDGTRIAMATNPGDRWQICILTLDGTRIGRIAQPETNNVHPAWSPDGQNIVFTAGSEPDGSLALFTFAP